MADVLKKLLRFVPFSFDQVTAQQVSDVGALAVFPTGFYGTNPSILGLEDGYIVCVRGVNYLLGGPNMANTMFTVGDTYMTVNRFLLLDWDFQLKRSLPHLDAAFDGVEDIKLFTFEGQLMGVGSCADPGREAGAMSIALLTIGQAYEGGSLQRLASPFGLRQEKNWAPFVHEGALHFIYSFDPLIILRHDPADGSVSFANPRFARFTAADLKFLTGGSSAGLPVPGGILFAAHRRRVSLPRLHRSYLSRLYHLDNREMTLTAGRYFSIGPPTVQFINGLAQQGEDFVISYGSMDRHGYICRVPQTRLTSAPASGVFSRLGLA